MGAQIGTKSAKVAEKGVQKMKRKNDAKTDAAKEGVAMPPADFLGRAGGKGGRFEFSKFRT